MPTRLSSVSPMIQRGDKNPFKVQHRSLFWKAECYFQEWGNGNTDIGQGIQRLYWAWVIVAHSFTSEVESHKLGFKIITNTALMPTGCAFNPGAESLKIQIIPLKIKAKGGHSNPRSLPENKNAKTSLYAHCCSALPLAKRLLNPATSLELY